MALVNSRTFMKGTMKTWMGVKYPNLDVIILEKIIKLKEYYVQYVTVSSDKYFGILYIESEKKNQLPKSFKYFSPFWKVQA